VDGRNTFNGNNGSANYNRASGNTGDNVRVNSGVDYYFCRRWLQLLWQRSPLLKSYQSLLLNTTRWPGVMHQPQIMEVHYLWRNASRCFLAYRECGAICGPSSTSSREGIRG
jgi:hypothetical protein